MTDTAYIVKRLIGMRFTAMTRREFDWSITLGEGVGISVGSAWRILQEGRVILSDSDDAQLFGRPVDLDAAKEAKSILYGKPIHGASFRAISNDLLLDFGDAILELLTSSGGYENWSLHMPGLEVICMGGGELSIYADIRDAR